MATRVKKLIFVLLLLLAAQYPLHAQSNHPVRLALVAENEEVAEASDLLLAKLSVRSDIQLLERNEVRKVFREQSLSTAAFDSLKLGRLLGADGLLLLNIVRTPHATNLTARLIAVKPGVILMKKSSPWPLKEAQHWSVSVAVKLVKFLPKLTVLSQEAIPISVVNLRSAVQSDAAKETERQLKLLTLQRLSHEPRLFILERQQMRLLNEEKELKLDDSAFWSGSYLLEGVVDQSGYTEDTVTINARLTPPKGGEPLSFAVRGRRTNFVEVVNSLATKVDELLLINSATVKPWSPEEEAAQYFEEANWALKWGVFTHAQEAADSAWALGKHDLECAIARVKAYEGPIQTRWYQKGEATNPESTDDVVQTAAGYAAPNNPWGLRMRVQNYDRNKTVEFVWASEFPDTADIDLATRALEIYYEFGCNGPERLLKVAADGSMGKNSEWYDLGIDALVTASTVLQHFNFVPESEKLAPDKLAELRRWARMVADQISRAHGVHDSYFVGDRLAGYDELETTFCEKPNIFRCEVSWGCFWQEKPEDAIALYRELMTSPAFCYIHSDFWLRDLQRPRLVAWNEQDQQRIPRLWAGFSGELSNSTNVLWQLEGQALKLADADNVQDVAVSFTNLFQTIFKNRDVLVGNPTDISYLSWHLEPLVSTKTGGGLYSDQLEALNHLFWSQYDKEFCVLENDYQNNTVPEIQYSSKFKEQKNFLMGDAPFDFLDFTTMFQSRNYSHRQAVEILPLIVAYRSNLVAQSASASGSRAGNLKAAIGYLDSLEHDINHILSPTAPAASPPQTPTPPPAAWPTRSAIARTTEKALAADLITNAVAVNQSFTIPVEKLLASPDRQRLNEGSQVSVTAHHWCEGKLLLDVQFNLSFAEGSVAFAGQKTGQAIAIFNPANRSWDIIAVHSPDIPGQNQFYDRTVLVNGDLYNCDGGEIREFDFSSRQWRTLTISDGNDYQMFGIDGRLYAANRDAILEIINRGKGTRVLASNRRRPPVSRLNTQDLGVPALFKGPNHSLRVSTRSKIFTLAGTDWIEDSDAPPSSFPPQICSEGALFRSAARGLGRPMSVSFLPTDGRTADLCFWQETPVAFSRPASRDVPPKSLWTLPPHLFLAHLPAAVRQSELYLLVDHSQAQAVHGQAPLEGIIGHKCLPKDGYEALLLCYSKDFPMPQNVYLNFDAPDSCEPLTGNAPEAFQIMPAMPPIWLCFCDNFLVFGLETSRIPRPGQPARIDVGGKASIWLLPVSKIEAARAVQKKANLEQKAHSTAAIKQER